MKLQQSSIFQLTVHFEDVDFNGVVHHPNYLKYLERARSFSIKACGYSVEKMLASGFSLVVSKIQANYLRPALIEQNLFVISRVVFVGKTIVKLYQSITSQLPTNQELEMVGEEIFSLSGTIFWAQLEIVCIDLKSAKPKSIPCDLKQAIKTSNKDLFLNTIPISNTETLTPSLQIV